MNESNKRIIFSLASVLWLLFGAQQLHAANDIDVMQAHNMNRQGALLLDVREPNEYAEAHAPNAMLIPLGQLSSRLQEIAMYKDKPIAVMCRTGRRSGIAVHMLQEAGYSQASNVSGGILAWEKAGLEEIRKQ
jgi:rhodanese-related sulfurtransferase